MSSPVVSDHTLRNTEHTRHSGFENFDVEHRTDSRRPLDQPPGTTTEMDEDEDGDSRRRRHSHSWDERSGCSLTADDIPE